MEKEEKKKDEDRGVESYSLLSITPLLTSSQDQKNERGDAHLNTWKLI